MMMASAESEGEESLPTTPTPKGESSKAEGKRPKVVLAPVERFDRQSNPIVTALSPPPSAQAVQQPHLHRMKSHSRLRSDSGLALHGNQAVFRQHASYKPEGSFPSRPGPAAVNLDDNDSVEDFRFCLGHKPSTELQGFVAQGKVIPDFFANSWVKMAFSSTETGQRIRRFAETRHSGADMDFVLKVEEYTRELGNMMSSMSYISSHFTSTTATSPLELPPEVSNTLRSNTKYCVRSALPALDKLYQDAKSTVEERLSRDLYPEFVKYQFSQCLTASLAADRSLTGEFKTRYPGLGEAFCLTDPLMPDNPIVYASDGLLEMCGFQRKELVGKNSRVLQGVATDPGAARRLSQAVAAGREFTELLLNYTPDQTPYWNFLFICPLMEHGSVRYFLGAQVNVSENMGPEYKDMEDVMKFGPPPASFHQARVPASPTSPSQPPRRASSTSESAQSTEQPTESPTSRRFPFFRRFRRKPSSARTSSPSPTAPSEVSTPSQLPGYFSPHIPILRPEDQSQRVDEYSTPYSRHFVMPFSPTVPSRRGPRLTRDRDPPRLPIAFCSTFALSLLGLRQDASHVVLNRDIFEVLSTQLGSPSVNRSFRKSVMAKLAAGESVHVDVMVPAETASGAGGGGGGSGGRAASRRPSRTAPPPPPAPPPSISNPSKAGPSKPSETPPPPSPKTETRRPSETPTLPRGRGGSGGSETGEGKPRPSGTFERGAELFSQVLHGGQGKKLRRFVSSWVPLKDAEGEIGFVVLVLTPGDVAAALG
ncbi:uncharacterized protein B0T15DRAFT_152591 [Chaetomium strumarium]|uniref:RGS domain-containing protein n=1 Tax=Chaetomium strumarium TaxID=1170767 RepID=A0AAJ0M2N7_9PEZI|nr:hypothetical protein B0T15DRAFT_152591 [Chaetomium strumarium]